MSTFDDMMKDMGRPLLMEYQGQSVTYKSIDQDDATIVAVVGAVRTEIVEMDGHRSNVLRRTITVSLADVAEPQPYDAVEVSPGDTWVVVGVENENNGLASLITESTNLTRVSRPKYDRGR